MSGKRQPTSEALVSREHITRNRETIFIAAYLSMLSINHAAAANGAQAAIRAGYAPSAAAVMSTKLLRRPAVKAAIAAKMEELTRKYEVTGERVLAEISKIAFSNLKDYVHPQADGSVILDLDKISRDEFAVVSQLDTETYVDGLTAVGMPVRVRSTRLKFHDKMAALTCLAKIQHLINTAPQINVQNNTFYNTEAYKEMQAMEAVELQEFEEFKKARQKVLRAAPPKDEE